MRLTAHLCMAPALFQSFRMLHLLGSSHWLRTPLAVPPSQCPSSLKPSSPKTLPWRVMVLTLGARQGTHSSCPPSGSEDNAAEDHGSLMCSAPPLLAESPSHKQKHISSHPTPPRASQHLFTSQSSPRRPGNQRERHKPTEPGREQNPLTPVHSPRDPATCPRSLVFVSIAFPGNGLKLTPKF